MLIELSCSDKWRRPAVFFAFCVCLVLGPRFAAAQQLQIDAALAESYFHEAQATSDNDKGNLWGLVLYGPLLFIDAETHAVVANQSDREGILTPRGGVYVGKMPAEMVPANTAIEWAGVNWTMVTWPPPELRQPRVHLLMHECFHRVAPRIGLPSGDASPSHLDRLDGRIWLRMEWRALEKAIWSEGGARQKAVADALYFRAFRRSIFPGAAYQENALEINEGLAEFTGVKLSTASTQEFAMVTDGVLRQASDLHPNFVRSFAYDSGPAYGFLLDLTGAAWRKGLTSQSDFGILLASAYGVATLPVNRVEAVRRAQAYDGDEVIAFETRRDRDRQAKLASARQRFINGPVLAFPVGTHFNFGFDPNRVVSVDENSTVYEGGQVSDAWGVLKAPDGFLMVRGPNGFVRVQVDAPNNPQERPLKGDGWTLELAPGWKLTPGPRPGDLAVKQN